MADSCIITITRQFGSMGRPIARKAAEELNIPFYDRDIVEQTAVSMGLPISYISKNEENQGGVYAKMKFPLGTSSRKKQDEIFTVQSEIIRQFARQGSCIIVGRCADFVLRDFGNTLNFYIFAPIDKRLENSVDKLGLDRETALKMVMGVDRARNAYREHYAERDLLKGKDCLINSGAFGMDGTVELIVQLFKKWQQNGNNSNIEL